MPMKATPPQLRPQPQMASLLTDGVAEVTGVAGVAGVAVEVAEAVEAAVATGSVAEGEEAEEKKEKEGSTTVLTATWTTTPLRSADCSSREPAKDPPRLAPRKRATTVLYPDTSETNALYASVQSKPTVSMVPERSRTQVLPLQR